ncbi:MAG: hypothetical protein ACFFDT_34050, partial [Candidatus Hodarchaeota archaeon]
TLPQHHNFSAVVNHSFHEFFVLLLYSLIIDTDVSLKYLAQEGMLITTTIRFNTILSIFLFVDTKLLLDSSFPFFKTVIHAEIS